MYRNKTKCIILLICVAMLASGCWDSTPIEDKDITTAVLVDKTEGGYAFYTEIASVIGGRKEEGGGGVPIGRMMYAEGPTFVDAREGLERQGDKPIYLAGVQCVLFTEQIAFSGIEEYMYRFRQNAEYRKTARVVVTGENPDDLFSAASENNALLGLAISDTLESLVDAGELYRFTMGDVLEIMACPSKGYLIPRVGLTHKGNDIEVNGFCVMDNGVCLGVIPIEEGEFIVYIRGHAPPFRYALPFNENSVTTEIRLKKKPPKVHYADGKIKIELRFVCRADLLYKAESMPVDDAEMQELEKELEEQLTEEFTKVIRTSQEMFRLDYLTFHEAFRIRYPDAFKSIDWKAQYPEAQITVDVTVDLRGGSIDYQPEE